MPGGVTAPALNSARSSDHRACGQRYLKIKGKLTNSYSGVKHESAVRK